MSETEPGVVRPSLKLRLENFRLFRDSTLFNLAPLTCLVGRNSSGKSSILSAILLLKQSLEQESIGREIAPLVLTGPYCDLGDYDDVVHNHMRSEAISFSFSMDVLDLKRADWQGDAPFVDLSRQKPMHDDYYFFRPSEKLPDEGSVNVRLTFSVNRPFGPSLSRVEVGVSEVGTASCIRTIRGERKQHWRTYTRGVPPRSIEFHLAGQRVFPWVGVRASQYKRFDQKRKKIIRLFSTVSNLLLRFLEGTLSRSEVIGPFRPAPERRYVFGGFGASRGGPTGEQAVNFLISETVLKSHGGRSLHGALAFWISHLKLAKSLRVKDLTHRQNLFEVDVKGAGSRAESNLSDVGFGVSQVLPVLVQGLLMRRGGIYLVQQPEIHLHPDAQAGLADFFIYLACHGVITVVETHSEHLLLRLRRRLAEGGTPLVAAPRSKEQVRPLSVEDVAVLYTGPERSGATVKQLDLGESFQFENLPTGFMSQALDDRLALLNAVGKRNA
jgi:hypothetical protein